MKSIRVKIRMLLTTVLVVAGFISPLLILFHYHTQLDSNIKNNFRNDMQTIIYEYGLNEVEELKSLVEYDKEKFNGLLVALQEMQNNYGFYYLYLFEPINDALFYLLDTQMIDFGVDEIFGSLYAEEKLAIEKALITEKFFFDEKAELTKWGRLHTLALPIIKNNEIVALMEVGVGSRDFLFLKKDIAIIFIALFCISFILIVFSVNFVNRILLKPLKYLVKHAELIVDGKFSEYKYPNSHDEVGVLVTTLNYVTKSINEVFKKIDNVSSNLYIDSKKSRETGSIFQEIAGSQSASIVQMSGTIANSTESLKSIFDKTESVVSRIHIGADKAKESFSFLDEIIKAFDMIVKQSRDIRKSLHLIDEITDETNLLALNASIEASKAGEFGLGFAVVAAEIRELAEKSQGTTQEIEKNIRDNDLLLNEAKDTILNSQNIIREVLETTMYSSEAVSEINVLLREQTNGNEELLERIDEIDRNMHDFLLKIEDIQKNAINLERVAFELVKTIKDYSEENNDES